MVADLLQVCRINGRSEDSQLFIYEPWQGLAFGIWNLPGAMAQYVAQLSCLMKILDQLLGIT